MAANANRDAAFVLAVDVGNTVTRFGLIARGVLAASWEFATRERMTSDEARLEIANFLNMLERERTRAQAKGDDARLLDSVFPMTAGSSETRPTPFSRRLSLA